MDWGQPMTHGEKIEYLGRVERMGLEASKEFEITCYVALVAYFEDCEATGEQPNLEQLRNTLSATEGLDIASPLIELASILQNKRVNLDRNWLEGHFARLADRSP